MSKKNETTTSVGLSADTIGYLDHGGAGLVIDHAIMTAVRDLESRGDEDGQKRTVTINLEFTKDDDLITVRTKVGTKTPAYATKKTRASFQLDANGRPTLKFQPESPDNPSQESFPLED